MSGNAYRAGPWPGLTPRGAGVLLGCAVLLAVGVTPTGEPHQLWPDLPILVVVSLVPLTLAARITHMPGSAAAVCGAYLLPRTLLSLVAPTLEPPPLLLVPAVAFDLCLWLQPADLAAVAAVWPSRTRPWRKRERPVRRLTGPRATVAGGLYGAALAAVVPPWAVLIGGQAAAWSGPELWPSVGLSVLGAAVVAGAITGRGRGW